jgi:hypothetical protein
MTQESRVGTRRTWADRDGLPEGQALGLQTTEDLPRSCRESIAFAYPWVNMVNRSAGMHGSRGKGVLVPRPRVVQSVGSAAWRRNFFFSFLCAGRNEAGEPGRQTKLRGGLRQRPSSLQAVEFLDPVPADCAPSDTQVVVGISLAVGAADPPGTSRQLP